MKKLFLIGLFNLLLMLSGHVAYACTCGKGKVEGAFNAKSYKKFWLEEFPGLVFSGQVIKTEKVKVNEFGGTWEMWKVTFRVERYWRGDGHPIAVIYTNTGCCSCGIDYEEGKKYFVSAQLLQGLPQTDICTAFTKDDVKEFMKVVGGGQAPKSGVSDSPMPKHNKK